MESRSNATPPGEPPRFLSVAFHAHFFPSLVWRRVRPRAGPAGGGFANHVPIELPVVLVVCLALLFGGLPSALNHGSPIGWMFSVLGFLGAVALIMQSAWAQGGTRPSFQAFRLGVFAFFLALGLTLGVALGTGLHAGALKALAAALGLGAGYLAGIGAGLWVQYLGWIAAWIELAAALAALGMVVVDLVLVLG